MPHFSRPWRIAFSLWNQVQQMQSAVIVFCAAIVAVTDFSDLVTDAGFVRRRAGMMGFHSQLFNKVSFKKSFV